MRRSHRFVLGIGLLAALIALLFCLKGRHAKKGDLPSAPRSVAEPTARPSPSVTTPAHVSVQPKPPPVERGKGVAVVASSKMVEQRAIEFSNLVSTIWSAELGTVFAAGDGAGDVSVPAGMEVNALEQALSRCAMCLLLWDEDVAQSAIKALKDYCETGGWLVFVSCPWVGSSPKSTPAELLGPQSFQGIAYVGAASRDRKAFALFKHPSLPELPVGERVAVYLQSSKALSGGEGRRIPLIRFEDPTLRGVTIQAMGHGGVVELNWDCPAGGRIGETDSQEFIKTALAWLSGKDSWKEPVEQPGVSLKVIARTPAGDPAPGAQVAVKVHTDWAKPFDLQVVTTDENGEADMPAKAPAIYTAWAAGEGYSSDTLALGRVEEGTVPEPLVVIVRPSLRIVGTAVYTGERTGPASEVPVDLLPSSRARGLDVSSAVTDKEGRFSFDGVPGGRPYLLRCETEEWAALEEIDLPESTDSGTFEVTLSLKKLVAIDGRVVEESEEQKPIEGATVRIEPYWGVKALPLFLQPLGTKSTMTTSDGKFRLVVLPDTAYKIRADAPGYVWRENPSEEEADRPDRTRDGWMEVRPPATVTLVLYAGTVVKGIAYLPGGQPAAGAQVEALAYPNRTSLIGGASVQRADSDGRFCFTLPIRWVREEEKEGRLRNYLMVSAKSGPYGDFETVTLPEKQREIELVLNLEELAVVQGIVTDVQERAVAGASLRGAWARAYALLGHSDDNGFFAVPVLGVLWVEKEGYESVFFTEDELESAAKDSVLLRVVLPRANGWVAGKVVLHDGTPLRNEMVDLWASNRAAPRLLCSKSNAFLGDEGEFQLEGIEVDGNRFREFFDAPIEFVDITVYWHPDKETQSVRVSAVEEGVPLGTEDAVVRFEPFGGVRGRVLDREDRGPVADVAVAVWTPVILRTSCSDAGGQFQFRWLVPDTYTLKVRCPGYFPWEKTVQTGPALEDVGDVLLNRELIVRGEVMHAGLGSPVEGAEIQVRGVRNQQVPRSMTSDMECGRATADEAGRFSVRVGCPFDDSTGSFNWVSYSFSVGIGSEGARVWRTIDASQADAWGVIELGRIELPIPEQR
jgi:hypothetical protein